MFKTTGIAPLCYEVEMINLIGSSYNNRKLQMVSFKQNEMPQGAKKDEITPEEHDTVLIQQKEKAPIRTGARIWLDKLQNAMTVYPAKGISGSKNANFYEFLTMGMVPFAVGSLMLMGVFNGATKTFSQNAASKAALKGHKMALGIAFYVLAKTLSKKLIEWPVKAKYGIDMNLPYKKVVNEFPEYPGDTDLKRYEYHKVYESVDFPRWDLLYDQKFYGPARNSYYDHIAKKMKVGENLQDADQQVKPKVRDLVVKTRTFSTLSSYLWAATGVALAMQPAWDIYGTRHVFKNLKGQKLVDIIKNFGTAAGKSVKELVSGAGSKRKAPKIVGIGLLSLAIASTLAGNIATLVDFKKRKSDKIATTPIIDENKPKVVC